MTAPRLAASSPWLLHLRDLPVTMKAVFTATLLTLGTGYLFAIANVGLSVGMRPIEIVEHYWGDVPEPVEEVSHDLADDSGEMSFDDLDDDPEVLAATRSVPSFNSLVTEGHFHLFGFAMIFFICGFIISFAELRTSFKLALIITPFIGAVCDIWSTLLTRFVGPGFVWMMMISGGLMALSFLGIFTVAIREMWFPLRKR